MASIASCLPHRAPDESRYRRCLVHVIIGELKDVAEPFAAGISAIAGRKTGIRPKEIEEIEMAEPSILIA